MTRMPLAMISALLLTACSPHPGAGNWTAIGENAAGISGLTLSYEGRALFTTTKPKASWHCFWSAAGKREAILDCTPSSNPDQEVKYLFRVNRQGEGELLRQDRVLGRFRHTEGKPEIS